MEMRFGDKVFRAEVRKASDLKPVLANPEALEEDFDAYFMFRDLHGSEEEREKIVSAGLRYDITVIPPAEIGGERIKTFGHYHPEATAGLSYPEIYQVLEGTAFYLIQKRGNRPDAIEDCIVVKASEGDCVLIPPNYGHVTINPSDKPLKMANWVCRSFKSIYSDYERLRGACYYYVNGEWVRNSRYAEIPELRFAKPVDFLNLGGRDMYGLVDDLSKLDFLVNPYEINIHDIFADASQ